ncbi:lipopolysaccharide assembly protein LapA domain-containing protein [uncultured Abyssibacter sp.]|uniref:lipopolysaccharide assembly protein LapA domain-containing protein n=1 Tax=uncultured Abyssibacter sp. TaxID=2320202 RepID=UPI0032B1152E
MSIALLVVACLGLALAFSNTQEVTVDLLLVELTLPLIGWMVVELIAVVVVMLIFSALWVASLKRQIRRQARQIKDQEAELKNLRNLPIHDV